MIITKTPYRISLFGGGTDLPGWFKKKKSLIISGTINKYVYLSLRDLGNFYFNRYRFVYSRTEEVISLSDFQHPVIRNIFTYFNYKKNFELQYSGELPARSGLGSSSSFVVGLINAIYADQKKKITKKELAVKSIIFEQDVLKENVGNQDQIATVYGGLNIIEIHSRTNFEVKCVNDKKFINKLNNNLFLYYTNIQRNASNITQTFVNEIQDKKKKNMEDILNIAIAARDDLEKKNINNFGKMLHETWKAKRELSALISNRFIDEIYEYALNCGAEGGKILGAGGGGFILFFVPNKNKKNFLNKFNKLKKIEFKFQSKGSELIYKNYE
jgi:D-glycero-alpha-D-manno-heptose-7-phosphate kinase